MATKPDEKEDARTESKPPAAPPGGLQSWLPLAASMVVMPVLAYALTSFVLIPKLRQELGQPTVQAREAEPHSKAAGASEKSRDPGKAKSKVNINKIVVNVSGSLGTRLMCASLTVAGDNADFKAKVEDRMDQLRDMAAGILSSKTIADLERPEARNTVRAELLSQFNGALGANLIQEIYLTEFAIQ